MGRFGAETWRAGRIAHPAFDHHGGWSADQATYRTDLAAIRKLPEGAALVAAVPAMAPSGPPLYHISSNAVILRDAFAPSLFATPWDSGSSVSVTKHYASLHAVTPEVVA